MQCGATVAIIAQELNSVLGDRLIYNTQFYRLGSEYPNLSIDKLFYDPARVNNSARIMLICFVDFNWKICFQAKKEQEALLVLQNVLIDFQ